MATLERKRTLIGAAVVIPAWIICLGSMAPLPQPVPSMSTSTQPVEHKQDGATPGPRVAHRLVYEERQGQVLLLDGHAPPNQPEFADVWRWDGRQWSLISSAGPVSRMGPGVAYDARRSRTVYYGGARDIDDARGDTWEFDGTRWHQMTDTSIGARDHHVMAYDEARGQTIMFGGFTRDRKPATDTWAWDGVKWTQVATEGPAWRGHFAMVYDRHRQEVVLFGGLGENRRYFNDTWIWNGRSWRKMSEEGPAPRSAHRMAYDRRTGMVLLYGGGVSIANVFEDMWQWNGVRWTEITMTGTTPGPRFGHELTYDAARGRTVLYGGERREGSANQNLADTWEWDGTEWKEINNRRPEPGAPWR